MMATSPTSSAVSAAVDMWTSRSGEPGNSRSGLKRNGHLVGQFATPSGPGRCDECGWHIPTQGHCDGCQQIRVRVRSTVPETMHNAQAERRGRNQPSRWRKRTPTSSSQTVIPSMTRISSSWTTKTLLSVDLSAQRETLVKPSLSRAWRWSGVRRGQSPTLGRWAIRGRGHSRWQTLFYGHCQLEPA
jgi:hypothetical protein